MFHRFERYTDPLLPKTLYYLRVRRHTLIAAAFLLTALGIGILGYHFLGKLVWIDAFVNASMILGGMGPVNTITSTAGKIFIACYALFSGILFIAAAGILFAPMFHRFLHKFHMESKGGGE